MHKHEGGRPRPPPSEARPKAGERKLTNYQARCSRRPGGGSGRGRHAIAASSVWNTVEKKGLENL